MEIQEESGISTRKSANKKGSLKLPVELLLDFLKSIESDKFHQLILLKKCSHYLYCFINNYRSKLAPETFNSLAFTMGPRTQRKLNSIAFPLSDHLVNKYQSFIYNQIPLPVFALNHLDIENMFFSNTEHYLVFNDEITQQKTFSLKFPLFPRSIDELKIVRFWLLKIFRSFYRVIDFTNFIFNPDMMNLLFDEAEIINLKFYCQEASLYFKTQDIRAWQLTFNLFVISQCLTISLMRHITVDDNNFLLEVLLSRGNRIPRVSFNQPANINWIPFYDNLTNTLLNSNDLSSNVVSTII